MPAPRQTAHRRWHRRPFSLVELLVALTILSVVIFGMFEVIVSTQRIWRTQRSRVTVSRNAKLLFEIMTRDLQGITAGEDPDITWGMNELQGSQEDPTSSLPTSRLFFVSSSGLGANAADQLELIEVAYRFQNNTVLRYYTTASDTARYDFAGTSDTSWGEDIASDYESADEVIGGVRQFTVIPYGSDGEPITHDSPAARFFEAPASFYVRMTLTDPQATDLADINRHLREFRKHIYTKRD